MNDILTINDVELTQFHLHYLIICLAHQLTRHYTRSHWTFNAVRPISINGSIEISSALQVNPLQEVQSVQQKSHHTSHTNRA